MAEISHPFALVPPLTHGLYGFGLNVFYLAEKDWMWHKKQHIPLLYMILLSIHS
jgi:hypothetical protein